MMRPNDPRIRQRINQLSQNLESVNESAQVGLYTFSRNYIQPCFAGIRNCVGSCCGPCFSGDILQRRKRGRSLARVERNFGFYDDWDYDEDADDTIFGWGGDELDRLLAGNASDQPQRHRRMSYGARGNRRRVQSEERQDPNVIPTTSFLGFLESFPWRPRGRGVKYRPSAADLQENLSGLHRVEEEESLLNQSDDNEEDSNPGHGQTQDSSQRQRSSTQLSRETTNSLSSRGDLIPSDEEQEDAIPLDDSFEVALQRRGTGFTMNSSDGPSSRRSVSGTSLATQGSGSGKDQRQSRRSTKSTTISRPSAAASDSQLPSTNELSYDDLRREEEEAARHEELIIQKKRQAAETLARSRGLSQPEVQTTAGASNRDSTSKSRILSHGSEGRGDLRPIASRTASSSSTEPFPPPTSEMEIDESGT